MVIAVTTTEPTLLIISSVWVTCSMSVTLAFIVKDEVYWDTPHKKASGAHIVKRLLPSADYDCKMRAKGWRTGSCVCWRLLLFGCL